MIQIPEQKIIEAAKKNMDEFLKVFTNAYLDAVGGTDAKGWKKNAYIIYPNGKAAVSSSFLFIRSYPKVLPGSQIVVPEKPDTKKMTTGEWVSIGSVITSIALLIVTAFK